MKINSICMLVKKKNLYFKYKYINISINSSLSHNFKLNLVIKS